MECMGADLNVLHQFRVGDTVRGDEDGRGGVGVTAVAGITIGAVAGTGG